MSLTSAQEGGAGGGKIVAKGTPEEVADTKGLPTRASIWRRVYSVAQKTISIDLICPECARGDT